MKYNVYVPYENGTIVYNTLTYQVCFIEGNICQGEIDNFQKVNDGFGILTSESEDELNKMRTHLKQRFDNEDYRIEIMLTQKCNLCCTYCYQQTPEFPQIDMDNKTIEDTIKFINSLDMPANITFYGGEPLLRMDLIEYACGSLVNSHKKSIITNGVLLTSKNIKRLLDMGIRNCQITIDGIREIHNQRRIFPSGAGTYDVIVKNINEAIKLNMKVDIRINVSNQRKMDIQKFLAIFLKNDLFKKLTFSISDVLGDDTDRTEVISSIIERFSAIGYSICCTVSIPCHISSQKSYTIDSSGYIYPCMYYAGVNTKYSVGHISSGISNDKSQIYKSITPWEECLDCNLVGICAGGCRVKAKNTKNKFCQKELLYRTISCELKQMYLNSMNRGK